MRAIRLRRAELDAAVLDGLVLCHDLRADGGAVLVSKGRVLDARDVARVRDAAWEELHLIALDAGEVHEDAASERLAATAAGPGTAVVAPSAGHVPLVATARGVLAVEHTALRAANALEGICIYTLYDGQIVDVGEAVARAKILPFVIDGARLAAVEGIAAATAGFVRVRPFAPVSVGAVVQETLGDRGLHRFHEALGEKVRWFGATLLEPALAEPSAESIAAAVRRIARAGARVITLAGAKAMDPLDPAFEAMALLGARIERQGVPAHPGSLFWIAHIDDVPILGMPTCGLFSRATVFDLVLPRVLAGLDVSRDALAALGHGGFLTRDMAFRFPPYRATTNRGEVE